MAIWVSLGPGNGHSSAAAPLQHQCAGAHTPFPFNGGELHLCSLQHDSLLPRNVSGTAPLACMRGCCGGPFTLNFVPDLPPYVAQLRKTGVQDFRTAVKVNQTNALVMAHRP